MIHEVLQSSPSANSNEMPRSAIFRSFLDGSKLIFNFYCIYDK